MNEAEIYAQLTDIMRDVLMDDNLALYPDLSAKQVEGWDSFRMIEIVMAVEARFGIEVHSRELDSLECVGDLIRLIALRQTPTTARMHLAMQP